MPHQHWVHRLLALTILTTLVLTPPTVQAQTGPAAAATFPVAAAASFADGYVWSRWGAEQAAVVLDGNDLWIGGGGGLLRWNRVTDTYRRYTTVDGLPSYHINAVAVDGLGNRWFGGDGGLSRLDATEQWTHFTTATSDLPTNNVVGIAVGADGTLWLSHELPAGSVSRRDPDGSWHWAPSRAAAVTADYPAIVQTHNTNPIWTVADGAVWVDFAVFDGVQWQDRTPPSHSGELPAAMVAHGDELWALLGTAVFHWTGASWETLVAIEFDGDQFSPTALTVAPNGRLWLGGWLIHCVRDCSHAAAILPPDNLTLGQRILRATPVIALWPTAELPWAVGIGWFRTPAGVLQAIADVPANTTVDHTIVGGDGALWLHSIGELPAAATGTWASQGLDDQRTTVLSDDQWQATTTGYRVTAADRTPGGDVWLAYQQSWYLGDRNVLRRHQGSWVTYELPLTGPDHGPTVTDIFAQDERHTWFAYVGPQRQDGSAESGVLHLDDGGTPAAPADDRWTDYPFPALHLKATIAVDSDNHLWLGTLAGLFRWSDSAWMPVNDSAATFLCELTPAAPGFLLAQRDPFSGQCHMPAAQAVVIETSGRSVASAVYASVDALLSARWEVVSTATHRNPLFAMTDAGNAWYFDGPSLCRRAVATAQQPLAECTRLPEAVAAPGPLEVDRQAHVWFAGGDALWRWAPKPGFALRADPPWVWMTPAATRTATLHVQAMEGFSGTVSLTVGSLPAGIAATVTPATVAAGAAATVAITTTAAVALADHPVGISGVGASATGPLTVTQALTVRVTAEVFNVQLPVVAR